MYLSDVLIGKLTCLESKICSVSRLLVLIIQWSSVNMHKVLVHTSVVLAKSPLKFLQIKKK